MLMSLGEMEGDRTIWGGEVLFWCPVRPSAKCFTLLLSSINGKITPGGDASEAFRALLILK